MKRILLFLALGAATAHADCRQNTGEPYVRALAHEVWLRTYAIDINKAESRRIWLAAEKSVRSMGTCNWDEQGYGVAYRICDRGFHCPRPQEENDSPTRDRHAEFTHEQLDRVLP